MCCQVCMVVIVIVAIWYHIEFIMVYYPYFVCVVVGTYIALNINTEFFNINNRTAATSYF